MAKEPCSRVERLEEAIRAVAELGDDIFDMAAAFIESRDIRSLRSYGSNIASMARADLSDSNDGKYSSATSCEPKVQNGNGHPR
jgi:hypothetical protein